MEAVTVVQETNVENVTDQKKKKKGGDQVDGPSTNGEYGGQEATGPGAAGLLTGANDGAHQQP